MNMDVVWTLGNTLDQMERNAIQIAFKFFQGNKTQTSISLGISIRTLEAKLEKYANDDKSERQRATHDANGNDEWSKRARGLSPPLATSEIERRINDSNRVAKEPEESTDDVDPGTGLRVEPAVEIPAQQSMPVSVEKEVQSVLPKQASQGGNKQRGR